MSKVKNKKDDFDPGIILSKEKRKRWAEAEEERGENIEESLSEIYRDEKGEMMDVDKLNIKKKRGVIFWFSNFLFLGLLLIVVGLGAYYYFYNKGTDSTAVDLLIESEDIVNANEEFFYKIKYRNLSNIALTNVRIELKYPDNFIFSEAEPAAAENNKVWTMERIGARNIGEIKIKGRIIGKPQSTNVILAEMTYIPENFSSEFLKEASFRTTLRDIGLSADLNYPSSSLVGDEDEILITLVSQANNYFDKFELEIVKGTNIRTLALEKEKDSNLSLAETENATWMISDLDGEEELVLKYRILEKKTEKEEIIFRFSYDNEDGEKVVFYEEKAEIEVMKSDLNLTLIVNGSQNNDPVDFEEKLNYSVVYANRGEAAMKDVVIMAVLESDFLDWTTLNDPKNGRERGNTITWTKEQIPALEKINIGDQGSIDFSISVSAFRESELGGDFSIKSFSQYNIGTLEKLGATSTDNDRISDDRSNTIINKINSDLKLKEEIRYFNNDNLPVGTGPLPPQIGEETTFKVYWVINNNLHELNDLMVEMPLPPYISWAEKNRTSVGNISYEEAEHKIIWRIGRLPITVYRADAEFSLSFTPQEADKNKIVVLTTGSRIEAKDVNTGDRLEGTTSPKTTKLDDDEIASLSSDGRVR